MVQKPGVRHYFAEGVTSRGYISLLPDMMSEWKRTYVLMGGPGTGKSTMIKMIGLELLDRGYEVDFMRSAQDPDSMAGFSIRRSNLAMLDLYEVAPLKWRAPGIVEQFVDFMPLCDLRKLDQHRLQILELEDIEKRLQKEIGIRLAEEFGEKIRPKAPTFEGKQERPWLLNIYSSSDLNEGREEPWSKAQGALRKLQKSKVTPFFLHGLDCEGWLNLAPHYLSDFDQIRLDGKETSEAMDWILSEAEQLGQIIDMVLHPLYPDKVIGIVFPQRNLAIWQGGPEELKDQGLDRPFSSALKNALVQFQNARERLKSIYMNEIDFSRVDQLRDEMLNQILRDLEGLK
ncbi:hypothetical protein [Desulfitobacterium metallireducens]|uniref:ATPase n=1 Tax=Desulfitobacterium metallireducens DSM 15288 TaxID=871968 RepID=W0EBV3_9FIRM|nr:hypothetical protein [Desulfitobacterium metallireducens]AHF08232.1 hypothetical protein DESME_15265 [Desulfitobacterium metallireducens DSM 15288]